MKEYFLRIKGLGVVSEAWLINNRGDLVYSQVSSALNKKMLADLSQRALQLLALQSAFVGAQTDYVCLHADELSIIAFDLTSLVLVAMGSVALDNAEVLRELKAIVEDMRSDMKLIAKYGKKGLEKRDQIGESKLDEKAVGLLRELRKLA